jgi:hypothetical protein
MSEDEASEMPQAFKDAVMKTVPIIADEHERDVQAGNHNLTIPPFIHSFFVICSNDRSPIEPYKYTKTRIQ